MPKNLPNDKNASRKALIAWFIRFQSMCYKGQPFSQYEELEKEVLSRAASELKKRTLDNALPKMLFINFAAQATSAGQFQGTWCHEDDILDSAQILKIEQRSPIVKSSCSRTFSSSA